MERKRNVYLNYPPARKYLINENGERMSSEEKRIYLNKYQEKRKRNKGIAPKKRLIHEDGSPFTREEKRERLRYLQQLRKVSGIPPKKRDKPYKKRINEDGSPFTPEQRQEDDRRRKRERYWTLKDQDKKGNDV